MSPNKPNKTDRLFAQGKGAAAGSFEFDQRVVEVFDDMVGRSVPGYQTIQLLVSDLALAFSEGNVIYDLGCSTGTTIQSIIDRATQQDKSVPSCVGIDSSAQMIEMAKDKFAVTFPMHVPAVNFMVGDFTQRDLYQAGTADAVLILLSLQFVRPILRQRIIEQAYQAIRPGGAIILVEKTIEADKILNGFFIDYYHQFKKQMGYSDLEISNKREALENVLIPYQRNENCEMLLRSGFSSVSTFFQWFNFAGFIGIK